ncbi:MAG: TetR/AcrR family transcriptional regulator [Bacteroidota bacterium]|jgi:AcrR family transcriptional regulator|nr:TetR/AcrR family transcriptional regulator [Bacteroidota bacterium]
MFFFKDDMPQTETARANEILDAFTHLAGKYTIDKTTMRDIARHMGVSVGIIYQEFDGKEDLIRSLLLRMMRRQFSTLDEDVARRQSPEEKLYALTVGFNNSRLATFEENPWLTEFLLRGNLTLRYLRNNFEQLHQTARAEHLKRITAVLKDGRSQGVFSVHDTRATANALMLAFSCFFAFEPSLPDNHKELHRAAEALFRLLTRGLRPDPA